MVPLEPDFIYRQGKDRAKSLSLHRTQDWETGLSFTESPPIGEYITFRPSILRAAGYVVRPDRGEPVYKLWESDPVIDPRTGQQAMFSNPHVTVYHSSREYWDQWHQADLVNKGAPTISPQLQALYELRER
jgi:hypothetical protein